MNDQSMTPLCSGIPVNHYSKSRDVQIGYGHGCMVVDWGLVVLFVVCTGCTATANIGIGKEVCCLRKEGRYLFIPQEGAIANGAKSKFFKERELRGHGKNLR